MAKAVMRFAKLKKGNLPGSVAHVDRQLDTPNADPDRQNLNITIGSQDARGAVLDRVDAITEGRYRKDAVLAYEFVLTAKSEWFADKSKKQVKQWAKSSLKWLQERFGKDNLVSATLHLDEAAPHLHAYVVPEIDGRLCAKEYTGTRKKCSDLQTEYAKAMEPYGLERGLKGSKAVHIPPHEFHSLINNQEVPELPGPMAGKKKREKYRQGIALAMGKQEAEIKKLSKANETLAKLTETIGTQDWELVKRSLFGFEKAYDKLAKSQQTLVNREIELEKVYDRVADLETELSGYQFALEKHGVQSLEHLSNMIETAQAIIERNRSKGIDDDLELD